MLVPRSRAPVWRSESARRLHPGVASGPDLPRIGSAGGPEAFAAEACRPRWESIFLTLFALTALGFLIAWPNQSTEGFHAIMNLVLAPMWMISGAVFPSPPPHWIRWVMLANPLTYSIAAMTRLLAAEAGPLHAIFVHWPHRHRRLRRCF